jgi:hypothetical protein
MKTAWAALLAAQAAQSKATPTSTRSYLHYQKWRVALNRGGMIAEASRELSAVAAMNTLAKGEGGLGETLGRAAEKAKVKGPLHA